RGELVQIINISRKDLDPEKPFDKKGNFRKVDRDREPADAAQYRSDGADGEPLQNENFHDAPGGGAHRFQDGDILVLLHDNHDQGGDDVEGGHQHDEAQDDEHDPLFEPKG